MSFITLGHKLYFLTHFLHAFDTFSLFEIEMLKEDREIILGSSLNAVVVFNLEVTHAARFTLKTITAFKEEPKKEKSPKDHE